MLYKILEILWELANIDLVTAVHFFNFIIRLRVLPPFRSYLYVQKTTTISTTSITTSVSTRREQTGRRHVNIIVVRPKHKNKSFIYSRTALCVRVVIANTHAHGKVLLSIILIIIISVILLFELNAIITC